MGKRASKQAEEFRKGLKSTLFFTDLTMASVPEKKLFANLNSKKERQKRTKS